MEQDEDNPKARVMFDEDRPTTKVGTDEVSPMTRVEQVTKRKTRVLRYGVALVNGCGLKQWYIMY